MPDPTEMVVRAAQRLVAAWQGANDYPKSPYVSDEIEISEELLKQAVGNLDA